MSKLKSVIIASNVWFYEGDIIEYVYGAERIGLIRELTDLYPVRITSANLEDELPNLKDVEVIFSCWGIPVFTREQLDLMPELKVVFYAAGSVNGFAAPLLERGITLCSAVDANAVPVAEFCLAQILLSCKGVYRNSSMCRLGPWQQSDMPVGNGVYGETIALIGIGAISRCLLKLLKPFNLRVIAESDYLTQEGAKALGIDKLVTIEEAFDEAYVICNQLPDRPNNKKVINEKHFSSMRYGATFINTGRGAQVDEQVLINVLRERPDLTALLDVQEPEPPEPGSPLYDLPNVYMTSHIAGSANDEVRRMADYMLDDLRRFINDEPMMYAVNQAELKLRA